MSVHHHQDAHCQLHLSCQGAHQLNFQDWSAAQHCQTYIYKGVILLIVIHQEEYHHFHLIFSHHQLQTHQDAHQTSKQYKCGFSVIHCTSQVYPKQVSTGTNDTQVTQHVAVYQPSTVVQVIVASQSQT